MDTVLNNIYFSLKTGYCNPETLYIAAKNKLPKLRRSDVIKWLSAQSTYTLHKPARRHYTRNRILVTYIDELWQVDLADLSNIQKYNNGYKYLLTCIDCFSKYAWAVPTKNKNSISVTNAMQEIFKSDRKPTKIQSDRGKEFLNKDFQDLLKNNDIKFYTTNNETKCSIIERFNRTLKEKMYRYFTYENTYKYMDVLEDLLYNYNNSVHRTIGCAPIDVNEENENEILQKVFRIDQNKDVKFKFEVGDNVRINKLKRLFDKGYTANWSEEIFTISKRFPRFPPVYTLKDYSNEEIEGMFYEKELQKVIKTDDFYVIEKILKQRKRNGKMEYFVKWRGHPDSMNSWATDIRKV